MSTAGAATAASGDGGAASGSGVGLESGGGRIVRGEKKAGRGRRRRSGGEQRRHEHQRWGQYLDEDDEDFSLVAPSLPNSRSRVRRNSDRHELEQYLNGLADDVVDPDVALALSISIAERYSMTQTEGLPASVIAGLTYESLAQLEDVRCVASDVVVSGLPLCSFLKEEARVSGGSSFEKDQASDSRMCVICQGEYDHGDSQPFDCTGPWAIGKYCDVKLRDRLKLHSSTEMLKRAQVHTKLSGYQEEKLQRNAKVDCMQSQPNSIFSRLLLAEISNW